MMGTAHEQMLLGKPKFLVRPNSAGGEGKTVKYFSRVTFLAQLKGFLSGNQIPKLKIHFFLFFFFRVMATAPSFSKG